MQSSIKAEIERYFIDNWLTTPIQFEGVEYSQGGKWIALYFVPIQRTGTISTHKFANSQLRVLCYDASPTLAIKLADEVNTFLDCRTLTLSYASVGSSDGLGVQDLGNNTYELASIFEVNSL